MNTLASGRDAVLEIAVVLVRIQFQRQAAHHVGFAALVLAQQAVRRQRAAVGNNADRRPGFAGPAVIQGAPLHDDCNRQAGHEHVISFTVSAVGRRWRLLGVGAGRAVPLFSLVIGAAFAAGPITPPGWPEALVWVLGCSSAGSGQPPPPAD